MARTFEPVHLPPEKHPKTICPVCGTEITGRRHKPIHCSHKCRGIGLSRKETRNCLHCNGEFIDFPSSSVRYCSRKCVTDARKRPIDERFWAKVAIAGPTDCWIWLGARHSSQREWGQRYGSFRVDKTTLVKSHRLAWELTHGEITDGLHVCHSCDNPPCVNPAHLFLGTHADNMADRWDKWRRQNGRAA